MDRVLKIVLLLMSRLLTPQSIIRDFSVCHEDYSMNPKDGVLKDHTFNWVAFVQYLHITTGLPHLSKAPRVTLVHRQFMLGTANDLMRLPKNYALGKVMFGDYEREEEECGLSLYQIKMGVKCNRAFLEIPVAGIWPHPEYSRFGIVNSLAIIKLLRPLQSEYMLPICLPTLPERLQRKKVKVVFMVDYLNTVPTDFDTIKLGKRTMKLYTHKECRRHRMRSKLPDEGITHALCTSGCGVRPGAPIATKSSLGAYELVGIVAGGAPCAKRSMRRRLNDDPPLYIDVYPYTAWIINVITAYIIPGAYPQNFMLASSGNGGMSLKKGYGYFRARKPMRDGWKGHHYMKGNFCFKKPSRQKREGSMFYAERFEVTAGPPVQLNVTLRVSTGIDTTISCARMGLPNRLMQPKIRGVGRYNISVRFATDMFPYQFYFTLELTGTNTTYDDYQEWYKEQQLKAESY